MIVVIVVGAAIAIAVVGVYLIAVAGVALFAWLLRQATRPSTAQDGPPKLVNVTAPSTLPPPDTQYRSVIPVDAAVFADRALAEATALKVFAAWAARLPKAPRDPSTLVHSLELRTRLIGRLTTRLEGRRFRWRETRYDGRDRPSALPPDVSRLNPWSPPPDLRSMSRHVAACDSCHGQGRSGCPLCGASGRQTCAACQGAGKYYGTTANGARRMLNCKTCRGKASVVCAGCTRGHVECPTCLGSGRLERWLEIEGGPRSGDVQVEPDGDMTRAFVWGKDGIAAPRSEVDLDARTVCEITLPRIITLGDLPPEVPQSWSSAHWRGIQTKLQPGEQLVEQTFALLEVPSVEVGYALGSERAAIELEGLRMLAPPVTADNVLARRSRSLDRLKIALVSLPLGALIVYLARGSYFFTGIKAALVGVIVASAIVAALVVYATAWHATLGRRNARKWAALAIAPIAIASTSAIVAEPSLARARTLVREGDTIAAKLELGALGSRNDPDLVPLWSALGLRETLSASTCREAAAVAHGIPANRDERALAQAHVDGLALEEARGALGLARLDDAGIALQCGSPQLADTDAGRHLRGDIEAAAAEQCHEARDWACALARDEVARELGRSRDGLRARVAASMRKEVDEAIAHANREAELAPRVTLQKRALDRWAAFAAVEAQPEPPELAVLRRRLAKDQPALLEAEAAARKKADAEERRRLAAAARERKRMDAAEQRERKRQEAARRREEYRDSRLMCCDGTYSPSCTRGGSRRGCCSHHGGVCD